MLEKYPCPRLRIVEKTPDGQEHVVHFVQGHATPKPAAVQARTMRRSP
jgi:hypothetical protein